MNNYKQPGDTLTLAAPYARDAGQGAMVGAIFGVAVNDVENGADGQFKTMGVFELAKTASQAWTQGDRVYWNTSTKVASNNSAVGPHIGHATEDAASAADGVLGMVRLLGNAATPEGPEAAIVTLTDSTTLSGSHNDTLADAAVPVDITGGQSPTEAEHNAALASMRIVAQNTSDLAQKTIEILAALVSAGIIDP